MIDCETLFSPPLKPRGNILHETDEAACAAVQTLLAPMILPWRQSLESPDISGVGALPGQQPRAEIFSAEPHDTLGLHLVKQPSVLKSNAPNSPSRQEDIHLYQDSLIAGYRNLCQILDKEIGNVRFQSILRRFLGETCRVVPWSTEYYNEIIDALWHPKALHNPNDASRRVYEVLASRESTGVQGAAFKKKSVIEKEISDLETENIPIWRISLKDVNLLDPTGNAIGTLEVKPAAIAERWHKRERTYDEQIIALSLKSAYLPGSPLSDTTNSATIEDASESVTTQEMCHNIASLICSRAVAGVDGYTWLQNDGSIVRPIDNSLYAGQAGIAICLASYIALSRHGAVQEIAGIDEILSGALSCLGTADQKSWTANVGGYSGLGGSLWAWLALSELGATGDALKNAKICAEKIQKNLSNDTILDI
ncbi:DUF4135 domain-containing protein, partial [Streptomyces cinereoruber]|uniref:DUF4135 domain-containing protein n=1 Tax=Streptomyces cinereoruber TaxID=67260 RepID=UPI00363B528B